MKSVVLVLGVHRSGTSALTRCLALSGFDLPGALMGPRPDNPTGFWESRPVADFNDAALAELGRSWDDDRPIDWRLCGDAGVEVLADRAASVIDAEFGAGSVVVLKDPRLCRLMPVWLRALHRRNMVPRIVFAVRNPVEVAASLATRNAMPRAQAFRLWLSHMVAAERDSRGLPRAVAHYEDLLDDAPGVVDRTLRTLGFPLSDHTRTDSALTTFVDPDLRHGRAEVRRCLVDESIPSVVRRLYADLLIGGSRCSLRPRLWAEAEATLAQAAELYPAVEPFKQATDRPTSRTVILHYHLFKNGGTSLDETLRRNFPDGWLEAEGTAGRRWGADDVARFIGARPALVALSSHTAALPVPEVQGVQLRPVLFLRHPMDRVRSIYAFERAQHAETEGARMAKTLDLCGYVDWRLSRIGDRSVRDFQTYRLAEGEASVAPELERAMRVLDSLPFVGVVERFQQSIDLLTQWLRRDFPHVSLDSLQRNTTQREGSSLEQRLSELRTELGKARYAALEEANSGDLALHARAMERYG